MKQGLFSIIIPTFNSEGFLEKCLLSINKQTYPRFEIIVVDQKSTDNTILIARKYKAKVIITKKPQFYSPPSASRNLGAKNAKGQFLYHLDSDMELSRNLLQEAINIFKENKKIGALMVPEDDKVKSFFSKCKALERFCYRGNDRIDSARIVRKDIFQKIKGYDENISSGEDFLIQEKYKSVCSLAYCRNVVYHDLTHLNFFIMIKKKYNYGKTAELYFKKSKQSGVDIVREEFLMYIKNYYLLISHPIVSLGMIFMKTCEILAGFLGVITAKYI